MKERDRETERETEREREREKKNYILSLVCVQVKMPCG